MCELWGGGCIFRENTHRTCNSAGIGRESISFQGTSPAGWPTFLPQGPPFSDQFPERNKNGVEQGRGWLAEKRKWDAWGLGPPLHLRPKPRIRLESDAGAGDRSAGEMGQQGRASWLPSALLLLWVPGEELPCVGQQEERRASGVGLSGCSMKHPESGLCTEHRIGHIPSTT